MDFNIYWLLKEKDTENLRYVLDNFPATRFYAGDLSRFEGASRKTLTDKDLEGKTFDFRENPDNYIFTLDDKPIFTFNRDFRKPFDIRFNSNNRFLLRHANYKNKVYLEIHFKGNIEFVPSNQERGPGIPFYEIKKS